MRQIPDEQFKKLCEAMKVLEIQTILVNHILLYNYDFLPNYLRNQQLEVTKDV